MFGLKKQPNNLMFDAETLKLSTNFHNNSHDKNIVPLQDLEIDFNDNSFIKSLVRIKYYILGDIGSVPGEP